MSTRSSQNMRNDSIATPPGMRKKPKLLLIHPSLWPNAAKRNIGIFPLGITTVAALTPDMFNVKLIDENHGKYEFEDADLVGITAMTRHAPRAYAIAADFRQRGIPVIMGGVHASILPDEALKYVDTVVVGEAEKVWKQVLDDYLNGGLKRIYKGEFSDLKGLPSARRQMYNNKKYALGTMETTRGCGMNCDYCSVTLFHGGRYRKRPIEEVLDELELIPQKNVFFVDDNLIGFTREDAKRLVDLCKGIVKRKIKKRWWCQAPLNFGQDEEVLKWASKSGCKKVFIGIETICSDQLKEVNKCFNARYDYDQIFRRINKYGIAITGAFIYGFDNETVASMREKMEFTLKRYIDAPAVSIMTPFPGTRVYDRAKEQGRLMYTNYPKDWELYEMSSLVVKLPNMDNNDLLRELYLHVSKMYSTKANLLRACKTLIHTRNPVTAVVAFAYNMYSNGYWKPFLEKYKSLARK